MLKRFVRLHLQACVASLGRLTRTPFASTITILVIGIALALPAGLWTLLQNAQSLSQSWDNGTQISLYLHLNSTPVQAQDLVQQLQRNAEIADVQYISPQQGLVAFERSSGMENSSLHLPSNPLPAVIVVQPVLSLHAPNQLAQLRNQLQQTPLVDKAKLDMAWIQRLFAIIHLAQRAVYSLAFLLAFAVLLIVGNALRMVMQNARHEISVLKLIGATHAFIRRPYCYSGIWYGLLGAIIAWVLVNCGVLWIQGSVERVVTLYQSNFQLHGLTTQSSFNLFFVSILLGLLGSWLAILRHLYRAES